MLEKRKLIDFVLFEFLGMVYEWEIDVLEDFKVFDNCFYYIFEIRIFFCILFLRFELFFS